MGTQSIPPAVIASIVFAFGSFAFYLYLRRGRREDLTLSLTCLGIVGYDVGAAGLYAAHSVSEGLPWQRLQGVALAFASVPLIHFVSDYTGQVEGKYRVFFTVWGLVCGLVAAFERVGLFWRLDQASFKRISLPAGISVTYFEAATGPLGHVQSILGLLQLLLVFAASLRAYRRTQAGRALALAIAFGVFCLALLNDMCVNSGWYPFVYVLEYGFLGIAVVIVLTITGELVEAGAVRAEREALEEQLRLVARMEAVGRLAGGVAHDLNNQLTPIVGYSELALKSRHFGPQLWTYFEQISDAGNHARELTQQLLAFARRQVLNMTVLDLNQLVADAHKMLKRVIPEHTTLEVRLDTRAGRVRADATQLRQILFNLVLNARDAMPSGGRLEISTTHLRMSVDSLGGTCTKEFVVLAVRDSGIGMDEATRARVFEPFFTTKDLPGNSGLGLATVYGIVRQHGGQITVQSSPGQGATFEVRLPAVSDPPVVQQQRTRSSSSLAPRGTVLVVEDEPSVRRLACSVLAASGFSVLDAATPAIARDLVQRHRRPIDLLVADVVMPEMTGPELYDRLRELLPELPVLFMSGHALQLMDQDGRTQLKGSLLPKPFSSSELLAAVEAALTSTEASRLPNALGGGLA
jgi:signal transduction histidine kinase/CheY-like chemotaxis protein